MLTAAAAKLLQSCLTLCDPIDGSPPGSPIPGILQARVLEWGSIAFSNAWKWKVKVKSLSRVQLFTTPWTAAYQAPPAMGFSRQEYWSGVPLPSPIRRPGVRKTKGTGEKKKTLSILRIKKEWREQSSEVRIPGKNTGVGCHFLLQCMKVKSESEVA